MKTNSLGLIIFISFFALNCTVKKVDKIAIIIDSNSIKNHPINELINMKLGVIEVFYISKTDTVLTIENKIYNKFWDILTFRKQKIPLDFSPTLPKITFSDGAYNLTFKNNTYETDKIIWALPLDSLKQENLKNIDLKRFVDSMKYFELDESKPDSLNYLENIYYLGKYSSKNKSFENTWDIITTHLIAKHSAKNSK